jgi:hypothetical protein
MTITPNLMCQGVSVAEHATVLAELIRCEIAARPTAAEHWRSFTDLHDVIDANELIDIATRDLDMEMPDDVDECERDYYPFATASVDMAEMLVWGRGPLCGAHFTGFPGHYRAVDEGCYVCEALR